ncbi:aspartate kinase, monofunctional class [Ahrensia sp. R2A130]|nr:aspartate kinase, monofunctional class [Ahrensia sp. R2A130]
MTRNDRSRLGRSSNSRSRECVRRMRSWYFPRRQCRLLRSATNSLRCKTMRQIRSLTSINVYSSIITRPDRDWLRSKQTRYRSSCRSGPPRLNRRHSAVWVERNLSFQPEPLSLARLVMKFGGTSVADLERIHRVARHVKREHDAGHQVAVVVSAMSGKTNELVGWVNEMPRVVGSDVPGFDAREYDSVVASGEQVTAGLLAIALQSMGVDARSWLGWQIPLRTDHAHGAARIAEIDGGNIIERMGETHGRQVAVVAGFQGISPDNRIATLGRGGSDTSAVALAAGIEADRCDIYTDVDGVYTTDPRMAPKAQRLDKVSYEEMLELASLGAKVLQVRSVELAMAYNVPTFVRSSFEDPDSIDSSEGATPPGTLICAEDQIVEQQTVTGIAYAKDEAQISLRRVADKPGIAAAVFGPLADAQVNVDMIVQNVSEDGSVTDMTFTVPAADLDKALSTLEKSHDEIGYEVVQSDPGMVKVSVVGMGMRSHAGVASTAFKALADKGINIRAITTSEIKISILIDGDYAELAVRTLHSVYGLDKS